jgi:tripartite-type tricarboxylate transporter receptor subunit TctC
LLTEFFQEMKVSHQFSGEPKMRFVSTALVMMTIALMLLALMMLTPTVRATPSLAPTLVSGQVQISFPTSVASIEYIRGGRLRALAVTTAKRSEALPDIPTVGEFLPGYEASGWYGIGAPNGTRAEIVDKLNKEINAALADPKLKARLADLGNAPLALSPADFGKFIADETEKWAKVVKFAGLKPE